MRKRSVTIDGHRTSISLEDAFWTELVRLARERSMSLNMLVAEVDHGRTSDDVNLSSALRLYVLSELVKKRDSIPAELVPH
ncbi:ribbon-helix-helix domain-containing protein [Reyranella aquatilis]|jgi:predicted DNA-binding ribbon-helix-helix protein|uniref:Ribbon-helix-helix domain-containing protein n=1 Tax=Reyranella aquatilis TaxID=2035356 RepID=A0ABS8L1T8_9HYPH|nr:ribbon-helix-helix domain-containing protein [Reyranella aquatilis]MCC8432313.1 ribbon-helix-helix domain-containing protein [Reyranella aquatilis]